MVITKGYYICSVIRIAIFYDWRRRAKGSIEAAKKRPQLFPLLGWHSEYWLDFREEAEKVIQWWLDLNDAQDKLNENSSPSLRGLLFLTYNFRLMDVQKELGKWKSEYVKCNTPEELADHKKRLGFQDAFTGR